MQCSYGWYRRWAKRYNFSSDPHLDTDPIILTWLLEKYDNNELISHQELRNFAQASVAIIKTSQFQASAGWANRFLKRYHILINWDGIYEKPLPSILESQINEYQTRLKILFNTNERTFICMDEIPLSFGSNNHFGDKSSNSKEDKNETCSRLRKIGIANCDATVILSILSDGNLLPPVLIVKV